MRHVGEELGLVPVSGLEFQALVLDLAEKPRILDRQGRLGREGLEQVYAESREASDESSNDAMRSNPLLGI